MNSVSKIDMHRRDQRHEFASDNTAAICPEVLAALEEANQGAADSYGDDERTSRVRELVRDVFETDCDAYLVFNGTAANALALAQLCQPFHSARGSKLLLVRGAAGKIDIHEADAMIARQPEVHAHKPRVISVTQATEFGTVYTHDEIKAITELGRKREIFVHMDGARFANAVAALGCSPKEITWQIGVDVLCFGGTKNGAAAAELVIFFKKELSFEFNYRLKQAGQLASKTRFLAAQWLGLLTKDVWLRNARHANATASRLADRLRAAGKIDIVLPVEANAVFVRLSEQLALDLQSRGWHFYKFIEPDVYRLMCSWATTDAEIDRLTADMLR